jgi:hypothetical protein
LASGHWVFTFAFPAAVATETRYRHIDYNSYINGLSKFAQGAGGPCINLPQRFAESCAKTATQRSQIASLAELKYRRDGIVKLKAGTDPN